MNRSDIVAERLLVLRKRLGLNQVQMGERVGFAQQTWSSWESGKHTPGVVDLAQVAERCSVSLSWLAGLSESMTGLQPGHYIIDLDIAEKSNDDREHWWSEVPNRHRVVDHREWIRIRDEIAKRTGRA